MNAPRRNIVKEKKRNEDEEETKDMMNEYLSGCPRNFLL